MGTQRLRRHQLVRLTDAGWRAILQRPWDAQAGACLSHWAIHRLPLVVTRQPADSFADGSIALGLPAPARWDRRRLPLRVPPAAVLYVDAFPRLADVRGLVPRSAARPVRALDAALQCRQADVRVFGSYGWQAMTGLSYVRSESDLDLWIGVDGMEQADEVAGQLHAFGTAKPRLDGEFVFRDGAAVSWREWVEWRAGRTRGLLVRRLDSVALHHDLAWCERASIFAELAA
ncbi:malonate decarboxylase holo-[acyl-carrier-protein] synthase [Variovorax sp. JS1663]|uniref:malonate decarboxylase holo-[acyl-carrier-protein] synthase n=1 Tax=Variovorax sp. JS1663 TaxID=1851577 RepID=UPI000B343877|nr:malonate decarboxylase holo-[acyl-carrier-protein] synthase [Variovorax sp. JS1663]OUM01625.1 malonate decarboxylase holo-[acyl-carrier-protein] synthase [Variovorax sp. JS1663]